MEPWRGHSDLDGGQGQDVRDLRREQWRRLMRGGRELAAMQTGNMQRWLSKRTTAPRELSGGILDGRKTGREATEKHPCRKILLGISANVGIGRAKSSSKSGTRCGKFWACENFGRLFGLLLEQRISSRYLKVCFEN